MLEEYADTIIGLEKEKRSSCENETFIKCKFCGHSMQKKDEDLINVCINCGSMVRYDNWHQRSDYHLKEVRQAVENERLAKQYYRKGK